MKRLIIKLEEIENGELICVEKVIPEDVYKHFPWSTEAEFFRNTLIELDDKLDNAKAER